MYCTIDDLTRILAEAELLQLADDTGSGALTDVAVVSVISEAIDQADREIDAYVGVIRAVPLDPVPSLIVDVSARMAIYNLFTRRPGLGGYEAARERYEQASNILRAVASGKMSIGPTPGATATVQADTARIQSAPKQFGRLQGEF